jgi:hypothetical protein
MIVCNLELNPGQLSITEVETPSALSDITEYEEIHLVQAFDHGYLIVTDKRVKILTHALECVKEKVFDDDMVSCCDFKNGILLISLLEGNILSFRLQDGDLLELSKASMGHEIFGASMTSDG